MTKSRITARLPAALLLAAASFTTVDANGMSKPTKGAFVYEERVDLFGYYMPSKDIRIGKYKLRDIAVGGRDDFKKFLGGDRVPNYAPMMIEFEDVTSEQRTNEMGQAYYVNSPRVLPIAFRFDGTNVDFDGEHKQIGHVSFTGSLAPYMFMTDGKREMRALQKRPALTGDLVVGEKTFKGVSFTWFGGD